MTAYLSPLFGAGTQLMDNNGALLSGGKIYTYQAGSAVLYNTWTDIGQSVLNANPIVLDASGRVPNEIWLASGIAYKFILQDSLSNVIGTWDNIQGINDANWSVYSGSASIPFYVGTPIVSTQAVQLKQVSLFPTVISATSPDIFGAAGATINYDNTTPVTATSFAACTAAQVGSVKKLIPLQNANMTASANLIIDGATSGTFVMPVGANIEIIPLTTTQFKVTTIYATGTWTPSLGGTATYNTQVGTFTKIGRQVTVNFVVDVLLLGTGSTQIVSGFPFAAFATNRCAGSVSYISSTATAYASIQPSIFSGTVCTFTCSTTAGVWTNLGTVFATGTIIACTITYFV